MSFPSLNLLLQSILSGVFIGALYGLLGLGLSLSWGLLRLINLAHFGFAFLAAYTCYQLSTVGGTSIRCSRSSIIVPALFVFGVALHWLMARFALTPFSSLLLTFGLTGIIEATIQWIWTADYRRLESAYGHAEVPHRRAVRAGARADHAGAGGGHLPCHLGTAALHRPGQGAARVGRGRGRSLPPSASTRASTAWCWRAPARRWPASRACAWRSPSA